MKGQSGGLLRAKCLGGISLALCLIMPVALLLMASIILEGRRARCRLDLTRGVVTIAESGLALYDRDLYGDLGLFALRDQDLTRALSSLIGPDGGASYQLEGSRSLRDPATLKGAIARHMTWRATSSLVWEALDKMQKIKSMEGEVFETSLAELIPSGSLAGIGAVDQPLAFGEDEEPEWYEEYTAYMDDEVRSVYQEGLANLAPAILPSRTGTMESFDFDPYTGGGLDNLASVVDLVLFTPAEGVLDRVYLTEYSLSYFVNQTPFVIRSGVRYDDRTPDGRAMTSFSGSRDLEVEEIATGFRGRAAGHVISSFISSIRFLLHLIRILLDEGLMAGYRATAAIVCATIAVISLGEIGIPPEVMTWILVVGDSLRKGIQDSYQLKKGYEVNLWPGETGINVPMRYRDYLRLLILVQSPDVIAERIAEIIQRLYPGSYWTCLACQGEWAGVSVSHAASFLNRPPPEDALLE